MSINSRFAVAVHILALLALNELEILSSKAIAQSVNTNPVFIRRILSLLSKAGLITTQLGVEGGSSLAQPADQITLLDVYRVTEPGELFTLHHTPPSNLCPCGRNIQPILVDEFYKAETALEIALAQTSVAQVARKIKMQLKDNSL